MRLKTKGYLFLVIILISGYAYISCTHDDVLISTNGPKIERGTQKLNFITDPKVSFDKAHSNVGWETAYLGGLSLLTGRFDALGMTSFNFDESNTAGISFEAWVWVNSVNTSEPNRDNGCLQTTFGVDTLMTTETANVAIIKSKSVELSTTDNGYIVKFDFTFHGVTKELTGNVFGFSFNFQFLAKTDFGIVSNSIADVVGIKCNAIFRQTQ